MHVLGVCGWSGSGKTTLLRQVIPELQRQGLRVSAIKQTHHDLELDQPGKDSHALRQCGAEEVMLAGPKRWFLAREHEAPPSLHLLLQRLVPVDLVLVEGFKHAAVAKIEVFRARVGKPPLFPEDERIIAVVSDGPVTGCGKLLPLNQPEIVAEFIVRWRQGEENVWER